IYLPSKNIIEDFIEFLSTWNIKDYYVRLWSDLILLGFINNKRNNRRIIERYLTLLIRNDQENLSNEEMKQYANIARQILKRFPSISDEDKQQIDHTTDNQENLSNEEIKQYANIARQILKRFSLTFDEDEQQIDHIT
ncbi:unnamed protein product, partial [Rotaria sordida]